MRVTSVQNRWSQEQLITGIRLSNWLKLLSKNKFAVSPTYYHRLAYMTGLSAVSSVLARVEDSRFHQAIEQTPIDPSPIFIVGHWRTGTTHLHNLLGRDPNHTFSTLWQVLFPDSFLTTGKWGPKLLRNALPSKRSYDNVEQGWHESAEDEIALMKLTNGLSFYSALMFPDQSAAYEKYLDFLEATPQERKQFRQALVHFIKKIMLATGGKRVVVKSCPHSARIRMLIDLFPNARFVHIHRHPARAFRSMVHMRKQVDWENFFQRPDQYFLDQRWEQTAVLGERLYTRLIEDRALIPPENLVEIAYSDFVGNELQVLESLYKTLRLPDWESYRTVITPYLDRIKGYQVNRLTIDPELEAFVYDRWRLVYDTYGYPKEYRP